MVRKFPEENGPDGVRIGEVLGDAAGKSHIVGLLVSSWGWGWGGRGGVGWSVEKQR